jgi:hypothetical protein
MLQVELDTNLRACIRNSLGLPELENVEDSNGEQGLEPSVKLTSGVALTDNPSGPSGSFQWLRWLRSRYNRSYTDVLRLDETEENAERRTHERSRFARAYAETYTKISAERPYRKISAQHKDSLSETSLASYRNIPVDRCRSEISSGSKLSCRSLSL